MTYHRRLVAAWRRETGGFREWNAGKALLPLRGRCFCGHTAIRWERQSWAPPSSLSRGEWQGLESLEAVSQKKREAKVR